MSKYQAFDGHNDVLLRLVQHHAADPVGAFLNGTADGHIDLPRARQGGMAGGLFAVFPPSPHDPNQLPNGANKEPPMPPALPIELARESTFGMIALLLRIVAQSDGRVALCRSRAEIDAAVARGALACVLHIEGIEAVDTNLDTLDILYAAGLRSLGPVWSRNNAFGHGVPFRFPASPDVGPGLTDAGKALVRRCNELGILIDLSHMNEAGFWDVAGLSTAPLVATHSNVHALCPSTRNLTDKQLAAIAESNGMVGLNFATGFLRPDGEMRADTGLDIIARHLDYLIDRLGEDRVGLGSDYDGASMPADLATVALLPRLFEHLEKHGYGEALIRKLARDNWLALLGRVIG